MQSIYDIKNRLKTVNSTVELTRAMYLISASRIRKAMRLYESTDTYFRHARRAIKHILVNMPSISHKFLQKEHDEHKNTAYIVIASNKGMDTITISARLRWSICKNARAASIFSRLAI